MLCNSGLIRHSPSAIERKNDRLNFNGPTQKQPFACLPFKNQLAANLEVDIEAHA